MPRERHLAIGGCHDDPPASLFVKELVGSKEERDLAPEKLRVRPILLPDEIRSGASGDRHGAGDAGVDACEEEEEPEEVPELKGPRSDR